MLLGTRAYWAMMIILQFLFFRSEIHLHRLAPPEEGILSIAILTVAALLGIFWLGFRRKVEAVRDVEQQHEVEIQGQD